jgi:hypothetical protein
MAFEFGKRSRDLEKELPDGGRGINHLHDTLESDLLLV